MDFQILVFENHDMYDSEIVSADKAIDRYLKMCLEYVSPEYAPEEYTDFYAGERFVKYHGTGGDKPKMVLMIGIFTPEMIALIKDGLKEFYIRRCEECHVVIKKKHMLICKTCLVNEKTSKYC